MKDEDLLACVRSLIGAAREVKEIKMFGGVGFMLNGNLLIAASRRGLLARVGKDAEREALSRPGATPMILRGRSMSGYIRIGAPALNEQAVASWIQWARLFVQTLPEKTSTPAKRNKAKLGSAKPNKAKSGKAKSGKAKSRKAKSGKAKSRKAKRTR
jgi:TfoX/Sxy family transcriptional regulator of competence genes